jgi:hypothetical protein
MFSPELANRMLPLVSRIVADAVRTHAEWVGVVGEYELAAAGAVADAPNERAVELQRRAQRLAAEIDGFLAELTALGVEFKGFEHGLVDFPSEIDGRSVLLCWRLGEPSVQFWHDADAGFAGRRSLSELPVSR